MANAEIYYDDQDANNAGWAYRVDGAESGAVDGLEDLLQLIKDYDIQNMDRLPTFGGDEPVSTVEVWSWDDDRLLVGTCGGDMEIINREDK